MLSLSRKLIRHACRMEYDSIPSEVLNKAKLCIIHTLACSFAGYKLSWSRVALEMVRELGTGGESSVWFYGQKTNAGEAAFANAVMAQSILQEDIHRDSNAHPGIIVIPCALAIGEQYHASGRQVLAAIVAGYEMMGRLGRATSSAEFGRRGFRPTSIIGTFGSSITAGKIIGLTEEQQVNAFGLAGNFTSGVNEWAHAGTEDLYFQNGIAARNGLIAACLAQKGVTAPETIIEGRAGICTAYGLSKEKLEQEKLDDGRYEIAEVLYKPAPACALVQTTAQVTLDVVRAGINPFDIKEGTIKTFSLGKNYPGCDYPGPYQDLIQARMSNQYNFAAILLRKEISDAVYQDYHNQEINTLAQKMKVEIDEEIDKKFPALQPVEIELHLKDGKSYRFARDEPTYMKRDEIISKLFTYCGPVLKEEVVQQLVEMVDNLEASPNIKELTGLFKVPGGK